jgi:hypothetical protein
MLIGENMTKHTIDAAAAFVFASIAVSMSALHAEFEFFMDTC